MHPLALDLIRELKARRSITVTQEDVLYRFRLQTMALARDLGNVRAACRIMGIHPST